MAASQKGVEVMDIKDSGSRREFDEVGGHIPVRDMAEGKGRFDLVPVSALGTVCESDDFIYNMGCFQNSGDAGYLENALEELVDNFYEGEYARMALDLAQHFEKGLNKYGANNWQGIPVWSFFDSAMRHYCKALAKWDDEPHLISCVWNVVCAIWTCKHMPELNGFKR